MSVQIRYVGFQLKANGRDYSYRVLNPKEGDREFVLSISNRAFSKHGFPYQDAAGLCYRKLQEALGAESPEHPVPSRSDLSDQDLHEYMASRRPARKRIW
ncbi:MAG TPA: hypothetical protein VFL79_00530 [Terriglobia bacterium]|nr:hypothetical protein [Terriglobia bacterium]